jgi:hypothetical protein
MLSDSKNLSLPKNLLKAFQVGYLPNNLKPEKIIISNESKDYHSLNFQINNVNVEYREAKVTAKKLGYFVTLWKRNSLNKTSPYDISENIDFYCFGIADNFRFGQFIFPKHILFEKGILSSSKHKGKLGFRLYTPSLELKSKQAIKTQLWQARYFLNFEDKLALNSTPKFLAT